MIRLLAASLILALTHVVFGAPVPKTKPSKEPIYFPTRVGAKWVYRSNPGGDITEVITAVQKKDGANIVAVGLELPGGQVLPSQKISVSEKGLFRVASGSHEHKPYLCLLRLPFKQGAKWAANTTVGGSELKGTRTAYKADSVEVPAGTFKAIRVESEYTRDGVTHRATFWYAAGIGLVKYVDGKKITVLKSFTPGGK